MSHCYRNDGIVAQEATTNLLTLLSIELHLLETTQRPLSRNVFQNSTGLSHKNTLDLQDALRFRPGTHERGESSIPSTRNASTRPESCTNQI